jgi:hypothetical protein
MTARLYHAMAAPYDGRTGERTVSVGEKQQLRFALAALAAGIAWGYVRHRGRSHVSWLSLLQGLEWFVAYGGAVALIGGVREKLEAGDIEPDERVTHFRQVVTERTGTEG